MEKEQKIQRDETLKRKFMIGLALCFLIPCGLLTFNVSNPTEAPTQQVRNEKLPPKSEKLPMVQTPQLTEAYLASVVNDYDAKVRKIKATGVIMETDEQGLKATRKLQDATRDLLHKRYGPAEPYRVRVDLTFQPTIPDFTENGPDGTLLIEMGPSALIPHSIFTYLEIARHWMNGDHRTGAFHRNAGHVLQVTVGYSNPVKNLAFQEYHEEYPHKKGTTGYCGRPSGPCWYVSIQNNTNAHGRGSQQVKNPYEADSCFGTVIEGFEDVVVKRIHKMPGKEFLSDVKKHVLIKKMTILVPGKGSNSYKEWKPNDV